MKIPTLNELFLPLVVAFVLTFIATPLVIALAKRFNLIDDPKTHKHPAIVHKRPTPRGGGVAIAAGIIAASLLFISLDKTLFMLLLAAAFAVIVGVLDDKYDLSPYLRFFSNFLVAAIVSLGGITVLFITNPLGTGVLSFANLQIPFGMLGKDNIILLADLIAVIWIVWTMNMLNWSTGVNGQMPGIAAISAITIGILSLRFSPLDEANLITAKLSFITAGAALGFLPFNFPKAQIFPGYGGTIMGFMLAALAILSGAKVATALLVMGVPVVDAIFTIVRRISTGHSPFRGDRGHFHHLLLAKGLDDWQIALIYWSFSALLGVVALTLSSKEKFYAFLALTIVVVGGLLWLSLFTDKNENNRIAKK
ncbi:undecaprenyl/decaprenyl-phosphate alpha-N-acetylglucosaminyl 1-phosphate transferase [Candidatus Microgenomates bacterium]|nr:undecaprenyl/decaprenyl-phosphate alpha-N-acetylglucosaminyl 1-phosphate transferase [Candidatus Microgenomates bacterium]